MTVDGTKTCALAAVTMLLLLASSAGAQAAAPVKLVLSNHLGWEVDKTTKANICAVASKDECQQGKSSSEAAGFEFPGDVAGGAAGGNMYVADEVNHRVQEFTAAGEFVSMFGKKVNKKGSNVCTKAEESECEAGESGAAALALAEPQSIAIDPNTTNVYVLDEINWRVDEYTANGQFVLMVGKEVNRKGGNVCTKAEESECKVGERSTNESTEKGAFNFAGGQGDLLAVGSGPEHLLYVGDDHRVQEFNGGGEWKGEIKLPSTVIATAPNGQITALAFNAQTGSMYVVYGLKPIVHEYDPTSGSELEAKVNVAPRESGQLVEVHAIAIDPSGHLAVWAYEGQGSFSQREFGSLYEASDGRLLTQFVTPDFLRPEISRVENGVSGIGFNNQGELYAAFPDPAKQEVWSYTPELVAELLTRSATCGAGAGVETSSTFDCTLNGEVNPYKIPNTKVWFEWGKEQTNECKLGSETAKETVATVEAAVSMNAQVEGLRPNKGFCYRLAGTDQNSELPEKLTGDVVFARTPVVAPKIVGQPSPSFVTSSSAVIYGELNPENANTEYFFEYASGEQTLEKICPKGVLKEKCVGVATSGALESEVYGRIGATLGTRGLQPNTRYHYRLAAKNEAAEVLGTEGNPFETAPAAKVEAETGAFSSVTTTSAAIAGTVNPDGQPATYTFESGVFGAATQYGTVISGSTGTSAAPESESVMLTGLQPGTTYAYRIAIHSGYGTAVGTPMTFTTAGLPSVLEVPHETVLLPVPPFSFPRQAKSALPKSTCRRGYIRDKHRRCIKTKPRKNKNKGRL